MILYILFYLDVNYKIKQLIFEAVHKINVSEDFFILGLYKAENVTTNNSEGVENIIDVTKEPGSYVYLTYMELFFKYKYNTNLNFNSIDKNYFRDANSPIIILT